MIVREGQAAKTRESVNLRKSPSGLCAEREGSTGANISGGTTKSRFQCRARLVHTAGKYRKLKHSKTFDLKRAERENVNSAQGKMQKLKILCTLGGDLRRELTLRKGAKSGLCALSTVGVRAPWYTIYVPVNLQTHIHIHCCGSSNGTDV